MVVSTWELHFEPMTADQRSRMENFLAHIRSGRPDAIDWIVDGDGLLHVMFEDLQHLRMVIEACDHTIRLRALTVEFSGPIGDKLRSWSSEGANKFEAKIELPWQTDDEDNASIALVTSH